MVKYLGIDEAGYGPVIGPLVVAAIASDSAADRLATVWAAHGIPIKDSKRLHKTGDIGPLEEVALGIITWATGYTPATAAEVFALLNESPSDLAQTPWTSQAGRLQLPIRREALHLPELGAGGGCSGGVLHPWHLNEAHSAQINRSQAQWALIARCLSADAEHPNLQVACDRLGGRTYYGDLILAMRSGWLLDHRDESPACCSYTLKRPSSADRQRFSFLVKGETHNALIAAASCVAKYSRELHMILLNQYWSQQMRWLKPTAGYPQDAARWLHQIGAGHRNVWGHHLERGWQGEQH